MYKQVFDRLEKLRNKGGIEQVYNKHLIEDRIVKKNLETVLSEFSGLDFNTLNSLFSRFYSNAVNSEIERSDANKKKLEKSGYVNEEDLNLHNILGEALGLDREKEKYRAIYLPASNMVYEGNVDEKRAKEFSETRHNYILAETDSDLDKLDFTIKSGESLANIKVMPFALTISKEHCGHKSKDEHVFNIFNRVKDGLEAKDCVEHYYSESLDKTRYGADASEML